MLGHLMEWFFTALVGIEQTDSSIGYKKLLISPRTVGDLRWADGNYQTPYGIAKSSWKKTGKGMVMNVTVPANSTAVISLPSGAKVKSGRFLFKRRLEQSANCGGTPGAANFCIGSGTYTFHVKQ